MTAATGPCHALGGARHRCDGPPVFLFAVFGPRRRTDYYRLCEAGRREWIADAEANGETLEFHASGPVVGGLPGWNPTGHPAGPLPPWTTADGEP